MPTKLSSPRRKRESPRAFGSHSTSTFESDGNSIYGNGSVTSSVIGHDDPTAVMGNIRRSDGSSHNLKSVGTIDSFVTTVQSRDSENREPSNESREVTFINTEPKPESNKEDELREQLCELDRAEEQWQAKMSKKTSGSRVKEMKVTADFYVNEVGSTQPSPNRRFETRTTPATIEEYECSQEEFHNDQYESGPESLSSGFSGSATSGSVSTKSVAIGSVITGSVVSGSTGTGTGTSTSRGSGSISTDRSYSSNETADKLLKAPAAELASPSGGEGDAGEIVRQVQRRLVVSQDNINANIPPVEDGATAISDQGTGKNRSWIAVGDGSDRKPRGKSLAEQRDLSDDDDSNDDLRYGSRRRRRLLICLVLVMILVGILLAILFTLGRGGSDTKIDAIDGDTSSQNEGDTESPSFPTPTTTLEPTILEPTNSEPTSIGTPFPTKHRSAEERLFDLSGDTLEDPTTAQHAAFQWIINDDPANLDLDSLPTETLTQRYLAALLYFSTDGDDWDRDFGFLQASDVCEWNDANVRQGIFCDGNGAIEEIALNENNLDGPLPSELSSLQDLRVVELRGNSVVGSIPSEYGELTMLEEIDLRENQLKGTVPESLFNLSNLRKLFLLRNSRLSGSIPPSIEMASKLELMSFQRCGLSGSLPSTIGKLTKLSFLTLMDNKLSGAIPEELTTLPKLEVLELSGNRFTGAIPDFDNQPDLYFISLFGNELGGLIPDSLGFLPGLLFLDIRDNKLRGSIPNSIGMLPDLVTFSADHNLLTGTIPSFAGNQGLLQAISLAQNRLTGHIDQFFAEDGPIVRLQSADFGSNFLSGTMPGSISKFTTLTDLIMDSNNLGGSIPQSIVFLTELDTLSLKGNHITGAIPEDMFFLEKLIHLDLSQNQLSGTIPSALGMLDSLDALLLESNNLSGPIPASWTALADLIALHLDNNALTGDLDTILCPDANVSNKIFTFTADCGGPNPEVTCTCCTTCCNDQTGSCVSN